MNHTAVNDDQLCNLQRVTLDYYEHEVNCDNGLIGDRTQHGSPASIAAVGMALATTPILVEYGVKTREIVADHVRTTLNFFWSSPQGPEPDSTGYKGFYYHFLDMATGRRTGKCELSTIDSAFLLAGVLTAAVYFDHDNEAENEIRLLADKLYRRVDWHWARHGGATVSHGWKPESGFLTERWAGYDEALLLYILGLGSPTYPLPAESYTAWTSSYQWKEIYGYEHLYSGPLFTHQLSHMWIDFRGIRDAFMRGRGIDYFENSRRATFVQQQYAIRNPLEFECYGEHCWGFTASDGPGWTKRTSKGVERQFFDYVARGVPYGPDDGTIAPWAVVASLPFAPEIVLPTIRHFDEVYLKILDPYGFKATFNRTFTTEGGEQGWVSPWHFGIDQGPIILMIENYRSGLLWRLMQQCPYLVNGLRQAGFSGGWLEGGRPRPSG
jgi:hypothetical protein